MDKNEIKVSIVIPVYNERDTIRKTIDEIKMFADKDNYEIIVVDDGSTDNVCILGGEEGIKVIRHSQNKGYGAALKTGIAKARNGCIVIINADGTYPNERIPELVEMYEKGDVDMVVGARIGKNVNISLVRKPAKWFISKLANYLSGTKIPDLNSGLRVMRKEAVDRFYRILPDGFSFTTTITLAMLTNNLRVHFTPIDYYSRKGKSKIRPIRDTFNFIQLIIRTILYFNPLRVFIPLSLLLALLAFMVLAGSWFFMGKIMDVTFGVILMTAVMVMAIGMLADLIDKRIK